MKRLMNRLVCALAVLGLLTAAGPKLKVCAAEKTSMTMVAGYKVTNETIIPGDDFTLTILLQNFSMDTDAENVVVVVSNPKGVAPEYGTVSQTFLGTLKCGETKEVSFRYTSSATLDCEELNFVAGAISDDYSFSTELRVPVGRTVDFDVEDAALPEELGVGKTGYASAMVETLGNKGVSNVVMVARCDGEDIASANIGTMSAGTTKSQSVSLTFDKEGQYAVELLLTYTNGEGMNKEFSIDSRIIKVVSEKEQLPAAEKQPDTVGQEQEPGDNGTMRTNNIIVMCLSGVLLIGVCCVILVLIYRRK
ncbi:MAG: hypothetical protein ACI4HQ_14800 [Acetatifactor sp.]